MPAFEAFDRLAARFPNPESAPPDGLLGYGGDLRPLTLLCAYSRGIFPWFTDSEPILWWSPDPRCVLLPSRFHLPPKSASKLNRLPFRVTIDTAFGEVIRACAAPRPNQDGTWITSSMLAAYERLHTLGYAHSVETWREGALVGGLYGVALGRAFFGESMFHREAEASRAALSTLVAILTRLDFHFIDCQQVTPHMLRMGAETIPRSQFLRDLGAALGPYRDNAGGICPWRPWAGKF